jgi:long-chain acyl-CoA synthetase
MSGFDAHLTPSHPTMLALWNSRVQDTPEAPFLHVFDETVTFAAADAQAEALARALAAAGLAQGDRVALYAQNDPLFVVGVLAGWKLGAIVVPINPMNTARELRYHLEDSGAKALVTLPTLWDEVAAGVVGDTGVDVVITGDFTRWTEDEDGIGTERVAADLDARVPAPAGVTLLRAEDLYAAQPRAAADPAQAAGSGDGRTGASPAAGSVPEPRLTGRDPAFLTYTSGTTGSPKGAVNTHANVTFNAETYTRLVGIAPGQPILAIAPLFHITGSVGHLAYAIRLGSPLVLSHRFQPEAMLRTIRAWRPAFTVGAITALMALADSPALQEGDLESFEVIYSGGAPIAPSLGDRLEQVYGTYIHNIYGMSETASPFTATPRGVRGPVDPASGALSVGKPVYDTEVRLVDPDGVDVAVGEQGEIWGRGPQITPEYWNRPEATAAEITDGWLHTGDVAVRDEDGWIYLVDRKKDMINASGYKVWPREVEGVLYDHPAVSEAAVVGAPDEYRGETVKAYVTLKAGAHTTVEELAEFCRENLSAYKRPRVLEIIDEMPKTATGKIMRRSLRD